MAFKPSIVLVFAALVTGCVAASPGESLGTTSEAIESGDQPGDIPRRLPRRELCESHEDSSPAEVTLAVAADRTHKKVGTAVDSAPLGSEQAYQDTLSTQFDYVTPGNELKWGSVQPVDPYHWDFTGADAIVAFAEAHHEAIKGHNLIWYEQLPPFVTTGIDAKLLRKYIRNNFQHVLGRYRGRIRRWDVVNEAIADDGSGLRSTVFSQTLGSDYIAWAFREAHEIDPQAELLYNDYGTETANPKSDAVYALVKGLLAEGVPIDGVGFEMHLVAATAPSTDDMIQNLKRFTDLGLTVNISELDVRVASLTSSEPERLATEKQVFHRAVAACLAIPRCNAVTTWGFTDKYTWITDAFGADEPLEFDTRYEKKPAFYGMIDGFAGVSPDSIGAPPNLVANSSFEAGLDGWSTSEGLLDESEWYPHTGFRSAHLRNRTASSQGPGYDLTQLVIPGHGYDVSAWARIGCGESDAVSLGATIACAGQPVTSVTLGSATATRDSWTRVAGSLQVPNCSLQALTIYVAGPRPGVDLYVDDAAVRPQPEPLGPNVVANPGFETGTTDGWVAWGGATIATTAAQVHTGAYSAIVSNRNATWEGPVYTLTPAVTPGATYAASMWLRVDGSASAPVDVTVKITCSGADDVYQQIGSGTATDTGWVQVSGTISVPLCSLVELDVYAEGPPAGVNLLVDDAAVEQLLWHFVTTNVIADSDFEYGGAGWGAFGGAFAVSSTFAYTGTESGVDSARTATWNGPSYALPIWPATYQVAGWALQDGTTTLELLLSAKLVCGGSTQYVTIGSATADPDTWVPLTGTLLVPQDCTTVLLYFQQGSGSVFPDIYVDEVTANYQPPANVVSNPGFESGGTGWSAFGGTFLVSSTVAHTGTNSGEDTARTATWNGPAYALSVTPASYAVSAWVYQDGSSSESLLLTTKLVCDGVTSYVTSAGPSTVVPNTWVELVGSLTVPAGCSDALLYLNQSGGSELPDLFIDDVSVDQ